MVCMATGRVHHMLWVDTSSMMAALARVGSLVRVSLDSLDSLTMVAIDAEDVRVDTVTVTSADHFRPSRPLPATEEPDHNWASSATMRISSDRPHP
jgi:hypothetical protein